MADDVQRLATDVAGDDPVTALGAIAELRRALDRRETLAVRRARNAGASWQLIATALGVSKQAVHKKHGRG